MLPTPARKQLVTVRRKLLTAPLWPKAADYRQEETPDGTSLVRQAIAEVVS